MTESPTSLLINSTENESKGAMRCLRRRKNIYLLAVWAVLISAILLTAAFAIGSLSISLDSPDNNYDGELGETESIDYSQVNRIQTRKKREVIDKLKEENEQAIMKLMDEPNCRDDCKKLQKQLANLDATIDAAQTQLTKLKAEIEKVSKGCQNRTSTDDDSSEVQLRLSPVGSGVLEDLGGRGREEVVDHDLAASQLSETRYPLPWVPDPGYPWPPAADSRSSIPPTGPDSSVIGEPTASGPGETVHTSQQMTVSLPKTLQKVCTIVPGPSGTSGYVCTPVQNVISQDRPPNEKFYLQVVGRSQTHVPTAISTPNPFAFPTLSGSPVIVPSSAAAPGQLVPAYNPKNGHIYMNNYQQNPPSGPYVEPSQQQQQFLVPSTQQQQVFVPSPQQQQFFVPSPQQQQVLVPSPQQQLFLVPSSQQQQQFLVPSTQQQQFLVPSTQQQQFLVPSSQQQQMVPVVPQFIPALYRPAPAFQAQYQAPLPVSPFFYQQQYTPVLTYEPQVYIPQNAMLGSQAQAEPVLKCSYVVGPNTPVQTYKFPAVSGVSETSRTIGSGSKKPPQPKDNSTKPKMNEFGNCPPGSRPCSDESNCIEQDEWCDSKIDCLDFSDEKHCSCKQRILHKKLCDGYFDCPRGEDEFGCFGCTEDMFSCDDFDEEGDTMTCLPLEKRCDSFSDCPNGKDEVGCSLITDEYNTNEAPVISFTSGFLFKNWNGKWYPACMSITWQTEACSEELGRLSRYPDVKLETMKGYEGLYASQVGNRVELVDSCLPSSPGRALWVDCPQPECGVKPNIQNIVRGKRDFPPVKHGQWVDHYPHTEDPSFQTTPEAIQFVKNFFNSVSIFDKKKFYKRIWGPLVQPYMGIKDTTKPQRDKENEWVTPDLTQSSWQYYLHPPQENVDDYNYQHYFPGYQGHMFNYGMQLHSTDPLYSYEYKYRPEHYINSYEIPFSENYIRALRKIQEHEEMLRVVGGSRSEPGAWPWLVVLYRDGAFHCGGSILTPMLILTAAHCVKEFEDYYYEVQAGVLRRFSFSPQEQIRKVEQVILHEEYDGSTMINDLALMKLSSPLKYNRWVLPICLPPPQPPLQPLLPLPGTICTAIGWGAVYEHGPDPDHLQEVDVPILPKCPHRTDQIGNEICAGYIGGGMDTCQGDSGGPLLCRLADNKWYIAGIVSHGEGCARLGEPGVYTRVAMYNKWIHDHLAWPEGTAKASTKDCPGPMCDSGRCLPYGSLCDSHIDCLHGEDELKCRMFIDSLPVGRSNIDGITNTTTSEGYGTFETSTDNPTESEERLSSPAEEESITEEEVTSTTEEEPSSTAVEPTTKEPIIHSEQTHSVNISQLFYCNKLSQRILSSRVCDKIIDCEDGSDEYGCTCKDHLKHLSPNLICDGQIDCRDSSDEKECPGKCTENEFYCYESNSCIPKEQQCNLEKDCYFGEDEKYCYALIDDKLQFDELRRPQLLASGTAISFSGGHWKGMCDIPNPMATALHICNHLGFRIARRHERVMGMEPLLEGDRERNCERLVIYCSSPINRMWLAPVFASGSPLTLAALIYNQWLLAPIAGLELPHSNVYLNTWLGKSNLSLEIEGAYDQYVRVNGLNTVGQGGVTLLHLEKPVTINHMTVPLSFPDWPTPVNEKEECGALGLTKDAEVVKVRLQPVACREGYRCYVLRDENPPICEITGLVECLSSYGSYLAAVIATNICRSTLIELHDLTKDRGLFFQQIENDSYEPLEEEFCDTVRCENGKCLEWNQIGDGISDCFDSRDEENDVCMKKEKFCQQNEDECVFDFHPGKIKCRSGEWLSAEQFCDGASDCEDGSDEEKCDCAGYLSLARPSALCDDTINCIDKSDELWSNCINKTDCSNNKFKCHLSGGCVPSAFICDGDEDCPNGEDEKPCIAVRSPPDRPKEGLVYSRLYGELVPLCIEPNADLAESICLQRGYTGMKSYHPVQVPYFYVLTDAFSIVRINQNSSLSVRPQRPLSSVEQDPDKNCTALYVICN